MLDSIKTTALLACTGLLLFMLYSYTEVNAQLARKEYENSTLLQSLQAQNRAIERLKLETNHYQKERAQNREKIITKYKSIPIKDTSCQNQLEAIKKDIELWYGIKREKP